MPETIVSVCSIISDCALYLYVITNSGYIHEYTHLHIYLPTNLYNYIPTYHPTYLSTFVPTYICLLTYIFTYLHTMYLCRKVRRQVGRYIGWQVNRMQLFTQVHMYECIVISVSVCMCGRMYICNLFMYIHIVCWQVNM